MYEAIRTWLVILSVQQLPKILYRGGTVWLFYIKLFVFRNFEILFYSLNPTTKAFSWFVTFCNHTDNTILASNIYAKYFILILKVD